MPEPLRSPTRLRLDKLEGREVPALFTALAADGLTLIGYDSDAPGTVLNKATVTGLTAGATLVGIDYRGSNSKLYGVSSDSRLYTVDAASGAATAVGATFTVPLSGATFGVDFNPAADKLRIVSNTGQNLRVNADTGAVVTPADTNLSYDPTAYDAAVGGTPPPAPNIVAAAYTQGLDATGKTVVTTLYDIDGSLSLLSTQGTSSDNTGADLVSPNTGVLFPVDKLQFTAGANTAFDIQPNTDLALVSVGNKLYTVNLATAGTLTSGNLPTAAAFKDLAIQPAAAGAGTFAAPATATFPANRGPLAITVTRTGGASVPATVSYATGGGDAVAGVDYLPASGTLSFAAGETTKQIIVLLPGGPATPGPAKTFNVTLSNPTGGATLGTTTATTVTIPAVATPPTSERGKFIAAGAGVGGGPRVTVYDAATGAQVGTFFAYEPTFTGGVTVASADVNGDGTDDIIVGSGVGGGPRVRVFDGATLTASSPTVLADFFAYESSFRGGVNVAAGDVTGDGIPELVIGSGVGGGPRVRVISAAAALAAFGKGDPAAINDFFAYEDTFRGGVTVAVGELTGDGLADVVAGSGVGGGPRVRVFDAKVLAAGGTGTPASVSDFFAYESTFRNGVNVATGVVTADGLRSILTGSGDGGGPAVGVFTSAGKNLAQFFAYDQALRGGVRVASADFGANGTAEIVTASGPGGPPRVRFLSAAGAEVAAVQPYENSYLGGVFVG